MVSVDEETGLDQYLDNHGRLASETGESVSVIPEDDSSYNNDRRKHESNGPCFVYFTVNGTEYLDLEESRKLSPRGYSAARILEEAQKTRPDVQPLEGLEKKIVEDMRRQAREKRENKPKERHLSSHPKEGALENLYSALEVRT